MAKPKFVADPAVAKQNMHTALEKLAEGLASVTTPEGLKQHLSFTARGNLGRYSFRNQLLIRVQCPGAFHVGGYHYWIKRGRRPLAGQGCRILAPSLWKKQILVDVDVNENPDAVIVPMDPKDPDSQPMAVIEKVMKGYRTVVVWDISRTTDAKGNAYDGPVPGDPTTAGPVALPFLTTDDDDEQAAGLDDYLRAFLVKQGVNVVVDHTCREYGSYADATKTLRVSSRHDPLTTCASTIHEAAHWQEFVSGSRDSYSLGELVAESVAYIVLARYGLDTSSFSFKYIKSYGGDQKMLQRGLKAIQQISKTLVEAIEGQGASEEESSHD